jgi:hypothetical protein
MIVQRDFRRDWGSWSVGERSGAVLVALAAFGMAIATFVTAHVS